MMKYSLDLAAGWLVCKEPESAPAEWAAAAYIDDSEWIALSRLRHLQLELCEGDDRWWGDGLREINSTAWWYRLRFDLPEDFSGSSADLDFSAVDYYADVWLNGLYLGGHEGDFGPFSFAVESALRPTGNVLSVRVRAPFGVSYEPDGNCTRTCVKGMYEHADGLIPPDVNPIGIWQPVKLTGHSGVRAGRPFVETLSLSPETARIKLRCPINSRTEMKSALVRVAIGGVTFDEQVLHDEFAVDLDACSGEISREYDLPDPKLWTVWQRGRPHLYKADVEIIVDGQAIASESGTFGVRTVELLRTPDKFTFLLNGEPLFIKGTSYIPDCYLSEMNERSYARDVSMAKTAHCNLLRSHVHIAKPEFYDVCDRDGMLVMQDSGLNWKQDVSPEFEQRALKVLRDMVELLRPHPSVAFWVCYNESSLYGRELGAEHPAAGLHDMVRQLDPTRPAFMDSGFVENDWERCGDSHCYQGSLASGDYWQFLDNKEKFNTEYGCTSPATRETLKAHPKAAESASNAFRHIPEIWDYQRRLIKFATENYRRHKYAPCGGCVHFMLVDMFPQIGLGVLDYYRTPKDGFYALAEAFAPVIVSLEHRDTARAIWVVNDLQDSFANCEVAWSVLTPDSRPITSGSVKLDIPADSAIKAVDLQAAPWPLDPGQDCLVLLALTQQGGATLANNRYPNPFKFPERPNGYPSLFDNKTGMKIYGYES
jgi:beta-mannosidase